MKSDIELLNSAKAAAENAYCPYSDFPAGAFCVYENGAEYSGCNVENGSYGLSLCAERNAISSAIAAGEQSRLVKIAIYSPKSILCFPCGACLQWIYEFSRGFNTEIILEDENFQTKTFYLKDIFPQPFKLI